VKPWKQKKPKNITTLQLTRIVMMKVGGKKFPGLKPTVHGLVILLTLEHRQKELS